jgi:hypothetical protein
LRQKRAPDRDPLALTTGQLARGTFQQMADPQQAHDFVKPNFLNRAFPQRAAVVVAQVSEHGEVREQGGFYRGEHCRREKDGILRSGDKAVVDIVV